MSDCRAAGTRAANSPWLIVFLLLAFGFTPVLRAQVHIAQSQPRTVHVFVALADNKNQGIVPVAAILGNGDFQRCGTDTPVCAGLLASGRKCKECPDNTE